MIITYTWEHRMNQRISHLNVGLEMNESEIKQQPQKQKCRVMKWFVFIGRFCIIDNRRLQGVQHYRRMLSLLGSGMYVIPFLESVENQCTFKVLCVNEGITSQGCTEMT